MKVNFDAPVIGSQYEAIAVDVKVDESSVANTDGHYGYFELKRTSDGSAMGGVNLTSKEWTTISFPIALGLFEVLPWPVGHWQRILGLFEGRRIFQILPANRLATAAPSAPPREDTVAARPSGFGARAR